MQTNLILNADCMEIMKSLQDASVNLTLTDIPYNEVNRSSNGLRVYDKGVADVLTFDLKEFLEEVYRVTSSTIIIFCGQMQVSEIIAFFQEKIKKDKGTVRQLIWEKSNPSPINGEYVYLSGIENAVWFKKSKGTFNGYCKNTVFKYPNVRRKWDGHPTEKNHNLLKELILDNSNEGDIVFDPCCGSGAHCLVAKECERQYIGVELYPKYYSQAYRKVQFEVPDYVVPDVTFGKNKIKYVELIPSIKGEWLEIPLGFYDSIIYGI